QRHQAPLKTSLFSTSFLCSWVLLYSPCVLPDVVATPGSATVINGQAAGTPIVNIVAPTAAGVSHNTFDVFNVHGPGNAHGAGVVINNSRFDGISALPGVGNVSANANFGSGPPARIILNEVTSTQRSSLLGTSEIFGDNASYILANPNGITCDGCGFIRTPTAVGDSGNLREVILSTSDALTLFGPNANLNNLSIAVNSPADIIIGPGGLNVSNVDVTTLFTRTLNIDGLISAANNRLQMLLGTGTLAFDAAQPEDRTFNATQSNDNAVTVAIDASIAGAMNAGQIYILATEDGVGVTLANDLIANAGDIELSANGDISYRNVNASNDFNVTTAGTDSTLNVTGTTVASNDVNWNLSGDADINTATDASINAGNVFNANCTGSNCTINAQDNLTLNATQVAGNADISTVAGKDLSINGDTNITGNVQSGNKLTIKATDQITANNLTSATDMQIDANTVNTNNLQSGAALAITTVGNTTTGNITAASTIDLNAATINTGDVESTGDDVLLNASNGNITTAKLSAGKAINITTQATDANLRTTGITSGSTVNWQLNGTAQLAGDINATDNINFNCNTPDCTINANSALQLDAQNLNTQANIQSANNQNLTINANVESTGDISSGNRLQINAKDGDINSSGSLSANQNIELASAADSDISIAGNITAGNDFIITGEGNYNHDDNNKLSVAGDWIIDTRSLTNNDTIIATDLQNSVFRVDEFTNNGLLQSDGPLTVQVDELLNNNGVIASLEGIIQINSSQNEGNTATINNNGVISAINLSQQQQPENTLIIDPQTFVDTYVADILAGKQRTSQDLTNNINTANLQALSQLTAGTGARGSVQINADVLNNNAAATISANQLALNVKALNNQGGLIAAAENIRINGDTLSNTNSADLFGVITARDNIDIVLSQQLDNDGVIEAIDVVIDAPIQNNNSSALVLAGFAGEDISTADTLATTASQPGFIVTSGTNSYYQYSPAGDNNPLLINSNLTQLTDTFLAASGTNVAGLPIVGDDLFLAQLLTDTLRAKGDIPFVTRDRNNLGQLNTLYSNTLDYMAQNNLRFGQRPNATQRQTMAAPIIVFEQQTLANGTRVLSPTVLLPNSELNTNVLAADQLNSRIVAYNELLLRSEQITNSGDLIAGNNLIIDTIDLTLITTARNWFISEEGEVKYHSAVISAPSLAVSINGDYVQKGGQLITDTPIVIEAQNIDIAGIDVQAQGKQRSATAKVESPDALYLLAKQRLNVGSNALLSSKTETVLSAEQNLSVDGKLQSGGDLTLLANSIRVGEVRGDKNPGNKAAASLPAPSLLAQGNILMQSETGLDLGYADIVAGQVADQITGQAADQATDQATNGNIVLLAQDGYINSQNTTLSASNDLYLSADKDINIRNSQLNSNSFTAQGADVNLNTSTVTARDSANLLAKNNLSSTDSTFNTGDLNLFADEGDVNVTRSELSAKGDMTLSAGNSVLLTDSNLNVKTNTEKDKIVNENLAASIPAEEGSAEEPPQTITSGNLVILADKGDIINTTGTLNAQNSGFMKAGGNIINKAKINVVKDETRYTSNTESAIEHGIEQDYDYGSFDRYKITKTTTVNTKTETQSVDFKNATMTTGEGGLTQIAGGDIINDGGLVTSKGNFYQEAEGSIKNNALTKNFVRKKTTVNTTNTAENTNSYDNHITNNSGQTSRTQTDTGIAVFAAKTSADGNLTQVAGKDIINTGSTISAGKSIDQKAEGNIKNLSLQSETNNIKETRGNAGGYVAKTTVQRDLITAETSAGENLVVEAKGDYVNTGNILATKNDIRITAKNIVNTRLTRKLDNKQQGNTKDSGRWGNKTTITTTTTGRQQVLDTGRVTAGGNIVLNASDKITDTAGRYNAGTNKNLVFRDDEGKPLLDSDNKPVRGGFYADATNGIEMKEIKWTERDDTKQKVTRTYYDDDEQQSRTRVTNLGFSTRDKVVTGNLNAAGRGSLKSEKGDINISSDITAGQAIALEGRNITLKAIEKREANESRGGNTKSSSTTNDVVVLTAQKGISFTTTGVKEDNNGNLTTNGTTLNAGSTDSGNVIMNVTGNTNLDGVNNETTSYFYKKKKKSWGRSKTTIRETRDVTLKATEINGGGVLLTNVEIDEEGEITGKDSGMVTLTGAKINMANQAIIYGEDGVNVLSGIEYKYERNETRKSSFGGFRKSGSSAIEDVQSLGHAEINAGGAIVLLSKNDINVVAGQLNTANITADAGFGLSDAERALAKSEGKTNVNIIGDKEALANVNKKYRKGLSFSIDDGFLSLAETTTESDWARSETYIGSVLNASDSINLRSASDVNIIGSQLVANNAINVDAGRDLNILSGVSTNRTKSEKESIRIGIGISTDNGFEIFAGAQTVKTGREQNQTLGQGGFAGNEPGDDPSNDQSSQLSGSS
ncbi:hypothetical protein MNBD_GAMMA15-1374, partial [hydrothermal vent metagenome]